MFDFFILLVFNQLKSCYLMVLFYSWGVGGGTGVLPGGRRLRARPQLPRQVLLPFAIFSTVQIL